MNDDYDKSNSELYSAGHSRKPVNFYYAAPHAKSVQLAGDFNHWHPVPMHQREDGWWFIQALLAHGHHQYHFLVDGQAILDPQALGTARDSNSQPVSLIAVS